MAPSAAPAQDLSALDYRRTLFVPFGQDMLMFEAPRGMCFLDGTYRTEGALLERMKKETRKAGREVLVAAFTDCLEAASSEFGLSGKTLMKGGTISWANPYIGEKTAMSRQDYLDMREATFGDYARAGLKGHFSAQAGRTGAGMERAGGYRFDAGPRRSAHGVSMSYAGALKIAGEDHVTAGAMAATLIRRLPVEFTLRFTTPAGAADAREPGEVLVLMDKFIEQQIALNE